MQIVLGPQCDLDCYLHILDGLKVRFNNWRETYKVKFYEGQFQATPVDSKGHPNGPSRSINFSEIHTIHVD